MNLICGIFVPYLRCTCVCKITKRGIIDVLSLFSKEDEDVIPAPKQSLVPSFLPINFILIQRTDILGWVFRATFSWISVLNIVYIYEYDTFGVMASLIPL